MDAPERCRNWCRTGHCLSFSCTQLAAWTSHGRPWRVYFVCRDGPFLKFYIGAGIYIRAAQSRVLAASAPMCLIQFIFLCQGTKLFPVYIRSTMRAPCRAWTTESVSCPAGHALLKLDPCSWTPVHLPPLTHWLRPVSRLCGRSFLSLGANLFEPRFAHSAYRPHKSCRNCGLLLFHCMIDGSGHYGLPEF
jgi:hypothetical protein